MVVMNDSGMYERFQSGFMAHHINNLLLSADAMNLSILVPLNFTKEFDTLQR